MEMLNEDRLFISKSLQGKIGPEQLADPVADDNGNLVVELAGSKIYVKSLEETSEVISIEGSCFSQDIAGIFSDEKPDVLNIMAGENTVLEKNVKGGQWSCKANTFSEDNYDVSILITKAQKRNKKND